jgi:hypothetical protein
MKLIWGNRLVLAENEDYVIVMKREGPNAWDPADEVWGQAQGFRVVTNKATGTFVMVPLGAPTRIKESDFKPGDLQQIERIHPFDLYELVNSAELVTVLTDKGNPDQVTIKDKIYIMDANVMPKTKAIR